MRAWTERRTQPVRSCVEALSDEQPTDHQLILTQFHN